MLHNQSMDKCYSQIIGQYITDETGRQLSRIIDVVLNTDTGKVVGFLLAPDGQKAIAPLDITSWNHVITVHDSEEIMDTEELHSLMTALKKDTRIYKNKVITKNGLYMGKVVDFAIDPKFFTVTKLFVAKVFLGIFFYERKIISQKQILEITKEAIIIRNPVETISIKKLSVDAAPTS